MSEPTSSVPRNFRPELLAPAGDDACLRAAVESGADAVYFGLQGGFNARARAANFSVETLPATLAELHRRGVKGYVALNTLVFSRELAAFEETLRRVAAAGADAVLVQDFGAARLARAVCPDLPLHASTQMSVTSGEGLRVAEQLGLSRVVLARELSLDVIRAIAATTRLAIEVFVHGALCVSYSGQCLASLAMGGRSANRGQCAQPCRLPYALHSDGLPTAAMPRRYPLSPADLAAGTLVPRLIAAGAAALKIEGRLKSPEYVAAVTAFYRRAIDAAMGDGVAVLPSDDALAATFSRGFTHGWLEGPNHQRLVPGDASAHRGVRLGEVIAAERGRLRVRLAAPVRRGDGVALSDATGGAAEQGGRVYEIFCGAESLTEAAAGRTVALAFGRGAMDWRRVRPGMVVWQTDDPRLDRQLRKAAGGGPPQRRVPVDLVIEATAGQPLCVAATAANGARCRVVSAAPLAIAQKHALSAAVLREQFARLGTSVYELRHVEARISGRPMAPLSILSALRRELIAQLDAAASQPPSRTIAAMPVLPQLRADAQRQLAADETTSATCGTASPGRVAWQECPPYVSKPTVIPPQSFARPTLSVVCRSLEQLAAACDGGADAAIADLADPAEWPTAVAFARARNVAAWLATPRIQQPADLPLLHRIASCRPDGVLVRNLGGLALLRAAGVAPLVADYTLNAVNELTAAWLCEQGCVRATAALDLSRAELAKLAAASPARWEIVIHLHVPLFHTAHCLFCANLSLGTDRTSCGGACRQGTLELEDRRGVRHRATADAACRNTIFHGQAQSAMESLPQWLARGLRYFRIELPPTAAGEPAAQWAKLVELYRGALGGNHGRGTMAKLKSLCPQGVARWGADRVRASGAVPTDPGGL